jgi:hypothetical protein
MFPAVFRQAPTSRFRPSKSIFFVPIDFSIETEPNPHKKRSIIGLESPTPSSQPSLETINGNPRFRDSTTKLTSLNHFSTSQEAS